MHCSNLCPSKKSKQCIAVSINLAFTAMGNSRAIWDHNCSLPPGSVENPAFTPSQILYTDKAVHRSGCRDKHNCVQSYSILASPILQSGMLRPLYCLYSEQSMRAMDTARAVNSQRRPTDDTVDAISSSLKSAVCSTQTLVGMSPACHSATGDQHRK